MGYEIVFKKRNKDIQAIYDLKVGESLTFKGTTYPSPGIYSQLNNSLVRDGRPYVFDCKSSNGFITIKKVKDNVSGNTDFRIPRRKSIKKAEVIKRLKEIKEALYGQNMGIDGWHQNGELMPFDELADHNGWFEDL